MGAAGWRWTEHVSPTAGTALCEVEHPGLVVSAARPCGWPRDERTMEVGDLFAISPGHDGWVVGDEAYASLRLLGDDIVRRLIRRAWI